MWLYTIHSDEIDISLSHEPIVDKPVHSVWEIAQTLLHAVMCSRLRFYIMEDRVESWRPRYKVFSSSIYFNFFIGCMVDHASTPEHASGCSNRHRTRCRGQVYTYLQFENPAIFESEKDSTRTDSTPTAAYLITQASWRCVDFRYKGFYLCVFFFAIWLGF